MSNTKTLYVLLDSDQDIVETFPENSNLAVCPYQMKLGKIYCCYHSKVLHAAPLPSWEKLNLVGRIEKQSPFVVLETAIRHETSPDNYYVKVLTTTGFVGYLRFWEEEKSYQTNR